MAAERLGPRLGGLIAATPQLSVLALVFFTLAVDLAYLLALNWTWLRGVRARL